MGITKSSLFSSKQNRLAESFKVLSHPARIAILNYLVDQESCINSTLVKELGLAQATISQHLNALKQHGLIKGTVDGSSMCYCINRKKWDLLRKQVDAFFATVPDSLNC